MTGTIQHKAHASQPHTLLSRASHRSIQSLSKSVSVQPHDQNDRQTDGRKKNTEAIIE